MTGPDALSSSDLAEIAGRIAGRPVEVVDVDDESYAHGLRNAGLPAPAAELIASFGRSTRLGFADVVSDVVPRLTGRAAISLRDLVVG